ncbi:MAG: hypothetical protein ACOZAA_06160 [Pseudomonadota bacterium]
MSLPRAAHATVAYAALLFAFFAIATLSADVATTLSAKIAALSDRAANVAMLEERLQTARAETREKLAALGAAPADLDTLAAPEKAKALVEGACAKLAETINAVCAMEETPLTETLARHQARLTASGPLPALIGEIKRVLTPPLAFDALTIKPARDGTNAAVAGTLFVAGARSAEPSS